jgi:hypothetical protein
VPLQLPEDIFKAAGEFLKHAFMYLRSPGPLRA